MSKRSNRVPRSAAVVAAVEAALGEQGSSAASPATVGGSEYAFVPTKDLPKARRAPHMPKLPRELEGAAEIYVGLGPDSQFSQKRNLPLPARNSHLDPLSALLRVPGDVSSRGLGLTDLIDTKPRLERDSDNGADANGIIMDWKPLLSRHRARRAAQHATWRTIVIPSLLQPFMRYLYSGACAEPPSAGTCLCQSRYTLTLTLTLADWDGCSKTVLIVCDCCPAALQLMARGYFPCAPRRPSIAFSIPLLELISMHSLHVAPNSSAWADTLHMFWHRRTQTLETSESVQKRLSNALHWFQVLLNRKEAAVDEVINNARSRLASDQRGEHDGAGSRASKRAREPSSPEKPLTRGAADDGAGRQRKKQRVGTDTGVNDSDGTLGSGDDAGVGYHDEQFTGLGDDAVYTSEPGPSTGRARDAPQVTSVQRPEAPRSDQ